MGLIEDYKDNLARISLLKKEIPVLQQNMNRSKAQIEELNSDITSLQLKSEQRLDTLMRERLVELTNQEYDSLTQEQMKLDKQIASLQQEASAKKESIQQETYRSRLSRSYMLLDKLNAAVNTTKLPEQIPPEIASVVSKTLAEGKRSYTQKELLKLINDVQTQQDIMLEEDFEETQSTFSSKLLDVMSLRFLNETALTSRNKLYVSLLCTAGMIACCFVIPAVPVIALSCSICLAYRQYKRNSKKMLDIVLPFSKLQDGANFLSAKIQAKVAKQREKDTLAVDEDLKQKILPLQNKLDDIKYNMSTVEERMRAKMSNKELKQSVEEQFTLQENQLRNKIDLAEQKLEVSRKELQADVEETEELKSKCADLIPQIKELYLNPTKPGDSPYLIKSFLISVDESKGKIDEFNYGGHSTFVLYKGESAAVNKPLITMMLMQFIANMSLANLKIFLLDIQSAGMNYAPFSSVVKITSSSQDTKKLFEYLNSELIARRDMIAAQEEDIAAFNKKRLETHGLPVPYMLVLLQDLAIKEMQEESVIQLVTTGPQVGIIPIVFVNHSYINSIKQISQQDLSSLERFLAAFTYTENESLVQNTFTFDGLKGNLSSEPRLIDSVLDQLRKVTR
jgi:hypothetical protein